ncbi:hypothetical protein ACOMHN_047929 [Nucella lapillus]
MGQTCILVCVVVGVVISLGLNLTALLTDHWYSAETPDNIDPVAKTMYNFHYGLWRLCYDENLPDYVAQDNRYEKDGSCAYIYKQLIERNEDDLVYNSRLRLHLSRTVLGCSIASGAAILASLISLLCGLCRLCAAQSDKRPCVYLSASLLLLLATVSGIASGICFIALRDLDNTTARPSSSSSSSYSSSSSSSVMPLPPALPEYVSQDYSWSFMLHWIGTGLALVESFLLLCLLRNSYEFVGEDTKSWSRFSNF